MAALAFSSIDDLKQKGVLANDVVKQLNRLSCDEVFIRFNKAFALAVGSNNQPENQYILFWRCCEVANIIRGKNGFAVFTKKDQFFKKFQACVAKIEQLTEQLKRRYEEARLDASSRAERVIAAPTKPVPTSAPQGPHVIDAPTIDPKTLMRFVVREKKSALIIDYRANQSAESISYSDESKITVISVPRDVIVPGLIFSTLKNQIPVGQRTLLNRLNVYDLVVVMDDFSTDIKNGEPQKGSPAFILNNAVYETNFEYRPKQKVLFLEGGFDQWKLEYPMYAKRDSAAERNEDSMDNLINKYKRTPLPEYPDISVISPPRRPRISPPPPEPPRPPVQQPPPRPPKILDEPANGVKRDVVLDVNGIDSKTAFSTSAESNGPSAQPQLQPPVKPSPIPPTNGFHGPTNGSIGVPPAPTTKHPIPSVDRSMKPGIGNNGISAPEVPPTKSVTPVHPSLDRSTKPAAIVVSSEEKAQLLDIYDSMAENIRQNSTTRSHLKPGWTGLYNMGNTCFMNATLQALFHTPMLINLFTKKNFASKINPHNTFGTRGIISAVFSSVLDHIWSGDYSAIKPQRFLRLFADEVNSSLADGKQHDASEFQLFLLDALHEDTNQVQKRVPYAQNYKGGANISKEAREYTENSMKFSYSPVNQIFNFTTVSELECRRCGEQSATFEESSLVSVELPHSSLRRTTLQQCLQSHFSDTILDGDARWNCPRCKSLQSSSKSTKLWKLPPILVVHLKRFSLVNGEYEKNNMAVDFDPEGLDMSPFLHKGAQNELDSYTLYAVTNHRGRLNSGHYTAIVSHVRTREWLRMDDETVTQTTAASIDHSDAYILYFKRNNL